MPRLVTALLIGAAMALVAACSPPADNGQTGAPSPEPTRPGAVVAPGLQQTPATGEIQAGGTFTRLWGPPPTLDPHLAGDTTSAGIIVEIFSGLVSFSPDLEIVPDLAESWTPLEGGTVYEFTLREGLQFSNGDSVTAADFKWSMERAANPATASPVAELYLGDIVGIPEIINGQATEASGIEVVDDRTLRITIDAPKPYFLAKLTYPTAFVVNRENVEQGGRAWTDNPVGTGPFRLEEYRIGQQIVLARNDHYHGRPAYLDRVVFNLAGGVPMAMYENNEIDIAGVGLADLDRVQDPNQPLSQELVIVPPGFTVSYIGFNVDTPPFDDPRFRQALNLAIDKELIANQVYLGLVRPAYGIIPPLFPGHSEDIQGLEFDLDRAQQLLAESDYADPATRPRITITVPGTGGTGALDLEVVKDMWDQYLGVTVEVQQVEWATYLQDLNRRRLQAFAGLGWQADYPDPQNFVDVLFHSGSHANHGGYSNPEVDALVEEARTEQDEVRRFELYTQAEQIIVSDAAWVPMWFDIEGFALVKPHIGGFQFTPMTVPKLKDVYIQR